MFSEFYLDLVSGIYIFGIGSYQIKYVICDIYINMTSWLLAEFHVELLNISCWTSLYLLVILLNHVELLDCFCISTVLEDN